jgi:hypothetical protein
MDSVLEELAKGLFRGVVYFVIEIFFGKICYLLGWPICKLLSFGKYPSVNLPAQPKSHSRQDYWCSFAGLVVLLLALVSMVWLSA